MCYAADMSKISDRINTERPKVIGVRLSPAEHEHLSQVSEELGIRLSSMLRLMALERYPMKGRGRNKK